MRYILSGKRGTFRRMGDSPVPGAGLQPAASAPPAGRQSADSEAGTLSAASRLEGHVRAGIEPVSRLAGELGYPGLMSHKARAEQVLQHLQIAAQLAGALFEDLATQPAVQVSDDEGSRTELLAVMIGVNPDLADELRALEVGETMDGGGGAAPAWSIKRVR